MEEGLLKAFAELGPALGSVAAVGMIGYFSITGMLKIISRVLDMFNQHGEALKTVSTNMNAHTKMVDTMSENIMANTRVLDLNTKVTERLVKVIDTK